MKDWLTVLIPVVFVVGGFFLQTYGLQKRVDTLENSSKTKGAEAIELLHRVEKRVYKIELQCQCAK